MLLFDFSLVHVPADCHKGPNTLSRRELGEDKEIPEEENDWLDEIALYAGTPFIHLITIYQQSQIPALSLVNQEVMSPKEELLHDIYQFLTTLELPTLKS